MTCWPGFTALMTFSPTASMLHLGDEVLHHRQRDVGFQQRHAHFAQRRIDIGLTERAAPGELVEDAA